MFDYALSDLTVMHLLYREILSNSWEARRLYTEIFPGRRFRNRVTFQRLVTVFLKQHLEGELADLAVCELYSLRKLCYSEFKTTQFLEGARPIGWWLSPAQGIMLMVCTPDWKHAWLPNVFCVYWQNFHHNSHNSHVWNFENSKVTPVFHYQQKFTINDGAVIVHDYLIGPYFLTNRLDGRNCHIFLRKVLPDMLENVSLVVRQRL